MMSRPGATRERTLGRRSVVARKGLHLNGMEWSAGAPNQAAFSSFETSESRIFVSGSAERVGRPSVESGGGRIELIRATPGGQMHDDRRPARFTDIDISGRLGKKERCWPRFALTGAARAAIESLEARASLSDRKWMTGCARALAPRRLLIFARSLFSL